MSTIRVLLGFICLAAVFQPALPDRHLLKSSVAETRQTAIRQKVVAIASAEVGIRETAQSNRGARVEEYLAAVGLKGGQS